MTNFITINDIETTFCPLVLSYRKENNLEWQLSFQSKPNPRIILKGRRPTIEEMVECLSYYTYYPISLIPVLMVAVDVAERED